MDWDVIIVGGGPAGMQSALTASYLKLKTLVIELEKAGGSLANKYPWKHVDEFLGMKGKNGSEVAELIVDHVKSEGATIREYEEVKSIERTADGIKVVSSKGEYSSKVLILTVGLGVPRKLGVPGEDLDGVLYSLSHPVLFKDNKVLVVGGGDTAVEQAAALAENKAEVKLIHRRDTLRASEKKVELLEKTKVPVLYNTEVKEIIGIEKVEKIRLLNNKTGEETIEEFDDILLLLGTTSNKQFLDKIGLKTDKRGSIVVDGDMKTNIEGVFAAGDVVGNWLRLPQAIGEGGLAAMKAFKYIKNPYWG